MKKLLIILLVFVLVLVLAAIGLGLYASHYLQTPAFKDQLVAAAREATGVPIEIRELKVSLFSGITLRGFAVANPPGFTGDLVTADEFILRYRLLPLLHKRVEVEQVSLTKPVIRLAQNAQQEWNYEKLGGAKTNAPSATPAPSVTSGGPTPLEIGIKRIALEHGVFDVVDEAGQGLVELKEIEFATGVNLAGGQLTGQGRAGIQLVNLAQKLFVRGLAAPVQLATEQVVLSPLSGDVAGGKLGGALTLTLKPEFKYGADLQVQEADVAQLLREASTKALLTGKLQLTAKVEGTGGLPTITGNGRAEIVDGQLAGLPALNLVALLLQMPELQNLKFTECVLEFTIANNMLQTPVIKLTAPQARLTGKGRVSLADYALDHELTLALPKTAFEKLPKEVRALFAEQPDGFLAMSFRVYGPYDAPKTDLKERLVKGATQQLIDQGLKKLLK